jgi:hypothetical protein
MQLFFRIVVALLAVPLILLSQSAAQQPVKQIKLTAEQIEAYLAAQPEVIAIQQKIILRERSGNDPTVAADIERAVKKHGLRDTKEYSDVLNTIILVLNRIDSQTRALRDTQGEIRKQIAEITADNSMPAKDKRRQLKDLNDALKSERPIEHPSNVDLVLKYYDKIEATH